MLLNFTTFLCLTNLLGLLLHAKEARNGDLPRRWWAILATGVPLSLLDHFLGHLQRAQLSNLADFRLLVDRLFKAIPNEPPRWLMVPANAAESLDIGSSRLEAAHDEQADAFSARQGSVVNASHKIGILDQEHIVGTQLLQPIKILAVSCSDWGDHITEDSSIITLCEDELGKSGRLGEEFADSSHLGCSAGVDVAFNVAVSAHEALTLEEIPLVSK